MPDQNNPLALDGGEASANCRCNSGFSHWLIENRTAINPISTRTASSFRWPNASTPTPMPRSEPGSSTRIWLRLQVLRYAHRPNRSIRHRIGSISPAAWAGEMTSASMGTAKAPSPESPPLLMPESNTAGMAIA